MELNEMQELVHDWAESKGWNDPEIANFDAKTTPLEETLARIALAHSELSEALERLRKGEGVSDEFLALLPKLPDSPAVWEGDHDRFGHPIGASVVKVLAKLALVHSEVSEASGAVLVGRIKLSVVDGKPEGLASEIADTHIRLLHLSAMLGHDSSKDFAIKMEYNHLRPVKHGKLA